MYFFAKDGCMNWKGGEVVSAKFGLGATSALRAFMTSPRSIAVTPLICYIESHYGFDDPVVNRHTFPFPQDRFKP
jgi:hypothetical protein